LAASLRGDDTTVAVLARNKTVTGLASAEPTLVSLASLCQAEGTLARLKAHRRELIDRKIDEHRGRIAFLGTR
jgi:hypothetical protein